CRGEAQPDGRAAPAVGQGAECGTGRRAEGTSALRRPEASCRGDVARPNGSHAAVPVDASRCIAIGQAGCPGPLPGADAGATDDPRSSLSPLAFGTLPLGRAGKIGSGQKRCETRGP